MTASPRYVPASTALAGARWVRSTRSTGMNNCVETARVNGETLAVRDSKDISGPALLFAVPAWRAFVDALHTGRPVKEG
ncbi:DUF397 domain-containing protein [Streptomyces sp. NPDC053542]|uniref:DUF397 domain-containing protein n=1 Tax=Streptomyces sp. NPDC053542 TaxID=3365710 RepID=UPI0037CEDC61